jgi:hypothetical protein
MPDFSAEKSGFQSCSGKVYPPMGGSPCRVIARQAVQIQNSAVGTVHKANPPELLPVGFSFI